MKAALIHHKTNKLRIGEIDKPVPGDNEVVIKLKTSAINHRELWFLKGRPVPGGSEIVPGSDGAGIVEETGSGVDKSMIGSEVMINASLNWGPDPRVQGTDFEILGIPRNGTFAEYICIDAGNVIPKPDHLSWEEAAAIPLAGLTAYRALFSRAGCTADDKVLVTGIGGGVALFALGFAIATGSETWVNSGDNEKIRKAVEMGAAGGVNYRNPDWDKELADKTGGFDVIIDSAGGPGFQALVNLAKPGGRISNFGKTAGNIENLDPGTLFYKQLTLHSTTMGNDDEFKQMIKLVNEKQFRPVIDSVYKLAKINQAYDRMDKGIQFGKIVIQNHQQ